MSAKITRSALALLAGSALAVSLSGCAALYPNWGATALPSDSASPSASQTQSSEPSSEPAPTASESTPAHREAHIEILQADADQVGGTLTVVAQMTTAAEDGGVCKLYVMTDKGMKDVTGRAESNVNTTQCYPLTLPLSVLGKGKVTFTVIYLSATFQGASEPQAITLP